MWSINLSFLKKPSNTGTESRADFTLTLRLDRGGILKRSWNGIRLHAASESTGTPKLYNWLGLN